MVINLGKETFEKEIGGDSPVIVDFWAEWCGPCKLMAPVFEELSKEYEGKLRFAKLDTEAEPELAGQNGVQGIPTLIVFKSGKEVGRHVGFADKETLKAKIDEILSQV